MRSHVILAFIAFIAHIASTAASFATPAARARALTSPSCAALARARDDLNALATSMSFPSRDRATAKHLSRAFARVIGGERALGDALGASARARVRELASSSLRATSHASWRTVYDDLTFALSSNALSCAHEREVFASRARAALGMGAYGAALRDVAAARTRGDRTCATCAIAVEALMFVANDFMAIERATAVAETCARENVGEKTCARVATGARALFRAFARARDGEAQRDFVLAWNAYASMANTSASANARALARRGMCRVGGASARERRASGTTNASFERASFDSAIASCTDVIAEEMRAGNGGVDNAIAEAYYARAWVRVMRGDVDGAAADVAGVERVESGGAFDVTSLRRAIDDERAGKTPRDLYEIVGLTREDALAGDWLKLLKRAYRRLALALHPDKNPSSDKEEAQARFHELVRAYKVLSNEAMRREYDATGTIGARAETSGEDWFDDDGASSSATSPEFNADEYVFNYDKRDVGADGRARGAWVHKQSGETVSGERDVRDPERGKDTDVCARRAGYCVDGRGGASSDESRSRDAGVEPIDARLTTKDALIGDTVVARLVRNVFGFQSVEFVFAFDVALPAEDDREDASAAKGRLRKLVRALHAALVGHSSSNVLTPMIEDEILGVALDDGKQTAASVLLDYVVAAVGGRAPRFASPQTTSAFVDAFAVHAAQTMRALGALGVKGQERTESFIRAARDIAANPLTASRLLAPFGGDEDDEASDARRLRASWVLDATSANARPFAAGDELTYEFKVEDSDDPDDFRLVGASLDFETASGASLADFTAVDQFGLSASSPAVNFGEVREEIARNGWISRSIAIPLELVGQTPARWFVACARVARGRVRLRLRNVRVLADDVRSTPDVVVLPSKS